MNQEEFDYLRSQHQQVLVDFLTHELGLGFAFISLGKASSAAKAALTVDRFMRQVQDPVARRKIQERLTDLRSTISSH